MAQRLHLKRLHLKQGLERGWPPAVEGDSGSGFGVTFVNKEEVYNQLLKGF